MNVESLFIVANEEPERMRANEAVLVMPRLIKGGLSIPIRNVHPADTTSKQTLEF